MGHETGEPARTLSAGIECYYQLGLAAQLGCHMLKRFPMSPFDGPLLDSGGVCSMDSMLYCVQNGYTTIPVHINCP